MHALQRGAAPACLSNYKHGRDNWSQVTPDEKTEIWSELNVMQGSRCGYCEAAICRGGSHIEHFRQKGRDPRETFNWANLFGSCNRKDSCGKHKDDCETYPPEVLIKPDVEDPELFLVFAANGSVSPRKNLSPADLRRATETIRIFNLNGPLRQIRFSELQGYVQTAEEFAEWASAYPPAEWLPALQRELEKTSDLPFATAIKHLLTPQD